MTRAKAIAGAIGLSVVAGALPAVAGQQVYTYTVVHPTYGEIGTFTDTIDRSAETTRIDSHLRVAVKLLGVTAYREESDASEIMNGNRLVSLESVTNKDGRHLEVHGSAQGDKFMVNCTLGSFAAPGTIAPSDPWVVKHTGDDMVVSTSTGKIVHVQVTGGDYDLISMNGASVSARHFVINGDKRQEVWLDNRDIPIMFRTFEDGTPIDFVMQNATAGASTTTVAALRRPTTPHSENVEK
ncbi:MAG TPA: DUF6134 family protein [Stellaceae bacterium]|nr:DUF6134 family protein [Stellaceae bacterium]